MITNEEYLIKKKFKRKYNRRLLSVLQHEMIHSYLHGIDFFGFHVEADSSPLFASVVNWFNTHSKGKIHIRQNCGLHKQFYLYNKELVYFSMDKDTTFDMLEERIIEWQCKLHKRLKDIKCTIVSNGNFNKMYEFEFNTNNRGETHCFAKYKKIHVNDELYEIVEQNFIALGMDINIYETYSEFTIEDLIYNCTQDDFNGYKHYMNTIDDVA